MRTTLHTHPCQRCGVPTACDGELEPNHDGFPAWICRAFHLASGATAEVFCDACAAPVPPVPTRRRYTFAVYVEAPEPVDENDCDGYTRQDVEALVKRTLSSYAGPRFAVEARYGVVVDWELMDSEPAAAAAAR